VPGGRLPRTLSRRALNRATLDRQLLLRRAELSALRATEHLVGLQAQTPHTWYVGLWSRIAGCDTMAVAELLTSRAAVRIALMRSTIHFVSAADALALRPLVQPVGAEQPDHARATRALGGRADAGDHAGDAGAAVPGRVRPGHRP